MGSKIKIEIKRIDFPNYRIKEDFLKMYIFFIINPIFYLFIVTKNIYLLILNFLLCIILILVFLFIYVIFRLLLHNRIEKEFIFNEDNLIIKYGKKEKNILYKDIKMLFIRKNIFGSCDIVINFPTTRISLRNINNNGYFDDKRSAIISNVKNYEKILSKLLIKIKFDNIENEKSNNLYYIKSLFEYKFEIFITVGYLYFITKNLSVFLFILILFFRLKKKEYNIKINEGICIFNKQKKLFLHTENYEIKNINEVILRIKNMDTLYGNSSNFVPLKYYIIFQE